jgi:hypothetical protein
MCIYIAFYYNKMYLVINLGKTERIIKNVQSRDTGNIGNTRHRTEKKLKIKQNKPQHINQEDKQQRHHK